MIQDLFLYFAKFPKRDGVKAMFTNGQSDYPDYQRLIDALDAMDGEPLLPDIDNYVYGQDFDDLKNRVERLFGSWLYADYGEFTFSEDRTPGSLRCAQQLAVTVAAKLSDRADMVERMIASDRTLDDINAIYARMMADAATGDTPWLARMPVQQAEVVPFVAPELKSYGWTLIITADAADTLDTNNLKRSFLKHLL